MPVTINGSGSISGLSVGGLGSGVVNTATLANGAASGSKLTMPSGSIIQTKQTYRTSQFSQSLTTGNFSDAVMTLSITPSSSSNKILVLCTVQISTGSGTNGAQALLKRDGTPIGIADADGNRARATGAGMGSAAVNRMQSNVQMTFLDSPSSTSALSYTAHIKPGYAGTQTVYLNREGGGHSTDNSNVGLSCSSLTLMEVTA